MNLQVCMRSGRLSFKILLIILLFIFRASFSLASPPTDSIALMQKAIIAQKTIDSADFSRFAKACIKRHEVNILMNTYRQVLEKGQKDMTISDLSFLYELNNGIDTNNLNENSVYICYDIGRIMNRYHLDSVASLVYNQRGISFAIKINDVCLTVKGYFSIAAYYMNIKHDLLKVNEYDELACELLRKSHKNGILDCNVDDNMGSAVLYYYLEDFAKGIEYLDKSIASVKLINKPQRLFDLYCRRAFFESEEEKYDKALKTLDTAHAVIQNQPNTDRMMNFLMADSFNVYVKLADYDQALLLSKKIILKKLDGDDDEYYEYLLHLVKMNTHFEQYTEAKQNIDLYTASLKAWNIQRWRNAYDMKYTLSKAQNNTVDALKYFEAYTRYNDSVHHQRRNFAVIAQQIKYQTLQKEEALKLQIIATHAEKQKANFIIAVSVALCLLLLLLLVYRRNKGLQEKDRLSKSFAKALIQNTEKEQHRLANELHDGLGQELLLLKNSLVHEQDDIKAGKVGDIIESVRGMARELYPPLLEVVGLKSAIESQLQKIDEQESIFISSEIEYSGELDNHTKLQVYRIFQEALTNVLKYAQATSVLVALKEDKGLIILTIKDNGVGFEMDEKDKGMAGFGLQSMKQRAESINGILRIHSAKNKGTEITLTFKNDNINS